MDGDPLSRFPGCPVLVVGDPMLDEYVWGEVSRVSPEAPVPVVAVRRRTAAPGGAANAAANAAALGGRTTLAGAAGADPEGDRLVALLAARGVDAGPVARHPALETTTKTRVVAHGQQVVRVDRDPPGPLPAGVEADLVARVERLVPGVRGCLLSDYGKGVVTPRVARAVLAAARAAGVPVVVDPKGTDYAKYRGAAVVTPNLAEAGRALGRDVRADADVFRAGADLLALLGPGTAVLVTRGADGMTLFEAGRDPIHVPAEAREVYDVTGAGDAVAAALTLALAAWADLPAACRLAARAAAVVVGKAGTATCTAEELGAVRHADV